MAFGGLRKWLEEASAQANPFDGGRTAQTVRQARQPRPTGADNQIRSIHQQIKGGGLDRNVGAAQIRAISLGDSVKQNTATNTLKPRGFFEQIGQRYIDTAMSPKLAPITTGISRSATGTGESLSGLYDLATPGLGNNRFGKNLTSYGKTLDDTIQSNNFNKWAYKGAQLGTDVGTFLVPGSQLKATKPLIQATKTSPKIARVASHLTKPGKLLDVGVDTAMSTGLRSNRGQDVNAGTVGIDAGTSLAFGEGVELLGKGLKKIAPSAKKASSTIKTASDKLDPAVSELDRQYVDLNFRWQSASAQGRKDIEKAILANRKHRDDITRPGIGLSTRRVNPEELPKNNQTPLPENITVSSKKIGPLQSQDPRIQVKPLESVQTSVADLQSPNNLSLQNQPIVGKSGVQPESVTTQSGRSLDVNNTTKAVKIKGPLGDAEYKARYGKDREPVKVKVKPFRADDYAFEAWSDKSALGLNRETLERNLDRVAGKDAPQIKKFLVDASRDNETKRAEFLNTTRERIRDDIVDGLGIRAKSKESDLVQKYGEGIIDDALLIEKAGKKADNIKQAAEYFRKEYDNLLDMWNAQRSRHNLDPVPKRKDYFRHFQEISDGISQVGVILNRNELPTSISGITDIFKPNKPFSNAELRRLGDKTTFDAVSGMDNYLDSVSRQIFHTDTVQRGRTIENMIRIKADTNKNIELPNFVANLGEWVNIVSGKKTRIDRAAEALVGRKIYGLSNWARKQTGANMVGANLSSAVTNFIPFTQSLSTTKKVPAIKGLLSTMASPLQGKSVADIGGVKSSFLTRRFSDNSIDSRGIRWAGEVLSSPFHLVDQFTSRTIVASKYFEGLDDGLNPQQAMKAADDYASKVMADRSIGQTPNIFNSQTVGLLTQFQLEVNNQLSFLGRDIKSLSRGDKTKMASSVAQFVLFSYMFNEAYEKLTGRRPQIDVVQAVLETQAQPDEESTLSDRIASSAKNITTGIPLANLFLDGGRLPVGSVMPDVPSIAKGLKNIGNEDGDPVASHIYKGVSGPLFYGLPPFGGGQLKKSAEGLFAAYNGESITPSGRERFKVEQSPGNIAKAGIFGQYATKEGKEYVDTLNKSKAGIKILDGTSKAEEDDTENIIKSALGSNRGKEFMKLKNDNQRKEFANQSDENRAIYDQYQAMKKGLEGSVGLKVKGLHPTSQRILDSFDSLTDEGKEKLIARQPRMEYELELAKYNRDRAEGKLTKVDEIKKGNDLAKLEVAVNYDKEIREIAGLSKAQVFGLITTDPNGQYYADNLLNYYDELMDKGLITDHPYRDKWGNVDFDPARSGSGGRSRKGGVNLPDISVTGMAPTASLKISEINAPKVGGLKMSKPNIKVAKARTFKTRK